jgi:histidinol-phosphate aminotransferase
MPPSFVRPNIRTLSPYTPGEQPAPAERVIKLNTNENPFPPSPKVLQAVQSVQPEMLRRYPDPTADSFRLAAAGVLNLSADMILAGNGSDDILSIATRTFLGPSDLLACPDPTYSLYPVLADIAQSRYLSVPWERDYDLPIDALLAARPRAIYFANPNAPTGTFVSPSRIEQLLDRFDGLVLVDEAYVDFADENCIPLLPRRQNLVICRSLSKAYSLAGLRFGFALAHPSVIAEMMKVKDSYNCDAIAIVAAVAAIQDQDYARQTWQHIRAERRRLTDELTALGWTVLPSHANFILATVPGGNARAAYLGLKQQGILVRYFDRPHLRDKVRITVGATQENTALLAAIKRLSAADQAA